MAKFPHFTCLDIEAGTAARLLFPSRAAVSHPSYGYVRSAARAMRIAAERHEAPRLDLPWRDYGHGVRTAADALVRQEGHKHSVFLGARNVLNEFGFHVRLDGTWFGRAGDPPLAPRWPAAVFAESGISFCPLGSVPDQANILTGLPLVVDGQPVTRSFIVANCSDPAHAYEVHPEGLIGPPPPAWQDLADAWEEGKRDGLDEEALSARLDAIAERYGAKPSRGLLHSVLAGRADGSVVCAAITGPLTDIAQSLVAMGAAYAIVLDNGGSVGWYYCPAPPERDDKPILLVAGPNHRPPGTAFLALDLGHFPQPACHPLLGARG